MPKLQGLQLLRAFAAISVLIGHTIAEAEYFFDLSLGADRIPWTRGVDVFFVISGFIITLSARRFAGRPLAFLSRRFWRVAPLYYVFTTLMVITLLLIPNGPKDTSFDLGQIVSSYGFIPYARDDGRIAPVLSLGWTLNYEMFFYMVCAIALTLRHSIRAACVALLCLPILGQLLQFDATVWTFWTNPIVIEFTFGILLAKAYTAGHTLPNRTYAMAVFSIGITLLIVLDATDLPRFFAAGIPATLIVASGTLLQSQSPNSLQVLGDSSYALYLSHRFTLRAATILILPLLPQNYGGAVTYVAITCLIAVAVSLMVHQWIERPLLQLTQRRQTA